jgi:hypothetical protein
MIQNAIDYEDPCYLDATHKVPVGEGHAKALLHVVSYIDKEEHVRVLAMALSFSESASDGGKFHCVT